MRKKISRCIDKAPISHHCIQVSSFILCFFNCRKVGLMEWASWSERWKNITINFSCRRIKWNEFRSAVITHPMIFLAFFKEGLSEGLVPNPKKNISHRKTKLIRRIDQNKKPRPKYKSKGRDVSIQYRRWSQFYFSFFLREEYFCICWILFVSN